MSVTFKFFILCLFALSAGCKEDVVMAVRTVVSSTDSHTDTETNTNFSTDTQSDSDTHPDTNSDTHSDTNSEPLPDTASDTLPDTASDTLPDTASDTHLDTESDTLPDTDSDTAISQMKGIGMIYDTNLILDALNVSWCFNFTAAPIGGQCEPPLFVPMIWGPLNIVEMDDVLLGGYSEVLGFNEPAIEEFAGISVNDAIEMWPQITVDSAMRVGSPAVSNVNQWWMDDFMAQVEANNLRVDFIAMHYFGLAPESCKTADELENMIIWAEQWDRPIWLTEFGCRGAANTDAETVIRFLEMALEVIRRHPSIERYAWFPNESTNHDLFIDDVITPLGEIYSAIAPR